MVEIYVQGFNIIKRNLIGGHHQNKQKSGKGFREKISFYSSSLKINRFCHLMSSFLTKLPESQLIQQIKLANQSLIFCSMFNLGLSLGYSSSFYQNYFPEGKTPVRILTIRWKVILKYKMILCMFLKISLPYLLSIYFVDNQALMWNDVFCCKLSWFCCALGSGNNHRNLYTPTTQILLV